MLKRGAYSWIAWIGCLAGLQDLCIIIKPKSLLSPIVYFTFWHSLHSFHHKRDSGSLHKLSHAAAKSREFVWLLGFRRHIKNELIPLKCFFKRGKRKMKKENNTRWSKFKTRQKVGLNISKIEQFYGISWSMICVWAGTFLSWRRISCMYDLFVREVIWHWQLKHIDCSVRPYPPHCTLYATYTFNPLFETTANRTFPAAYNFDVHVSFRSYHVPCAGLSILWICWDRLFML